MATLPKTNLRLAYHVACTIGETYTKNGVTYLNTDVGALCTSDNINIWSKYKPVNHTFTSNRPSDWWKGVANNCGIEKKSYGLFEEMFNSIMNKEKQFYHDKPLNIFRLGDFAGYNTAATPPIFEQDYSETTIYNDTDTFTFVIFAKQFVEDYELTSEDVWGPSTDVRSMKLGIAFRRVGEETVYWMTSDGFVSVQVPIRSQNHNIFKPGRVEMIMFLTPRYKPGFTSSITGSGSYYPIPNYHVHTLNVIDSSVESSVNLNARYEDGNFVGNVVVNNKTGGNLQLTNVAIQFFYPGDSFSSWIERLDDIYVPAGESKTVPWSTAALSEFEKRGAIAKLYANNNLVDTTFIPMPIG